MDMPDALEMPLPLKTMIFCAFTVEMSSTVVAARANSSCLSSLARLRLPCRTIFLCICTQHPSAPRNRAVNAETSTTEP